MSAIKAQDEQAKAAYFAQEAQAVVPKGSKTNILNTINNVKSALDKLSTDYNASLNRYKEFQTEDLQGNASLDQTKET